MKKKQLWPGWEEVRVLGSGGFGKVYEIRKNDEMGDYRAALKVISIPSAPDEYQSYRDDGYDDESITAIFQNQVESVASEFALMSQFKGNSNIVSYLDHMIVPHKDGVGWDILIRMELLTSLPEYLNGTVVTPEIAAKMGMDIAHALQLCEKKHVIHRDIKPQNIFINDFGDFKLGDFGIAKSMDHTTHATKTGTYSYMAPEVYKAQPYNSTADIYSLGLVLYWMLNDRKLPFLPTDRPPTASERDEAQVRRIDGEEFPEAKNGGKEFHQIICKACAADPNNRYKSAQELYNALESFLSQGKANSSDNSFDKTTKDYATANRIKYYCEECGAEVSAAYTKCQNCLNKERSFKKITYYCIECGAKVDTVYSKCAKCRNK